MPEKPRRGDLVIRRNDEGSWVVAVEPAPAQVRYTSLGAAISAAQRFARSHDTEVWQTADGETFIRVETETV